MTLAYRVRVVTEHIALLPAASFAGVATPTMEAQDYDFLMKQVPIHSSNRSWRARGLDLPELIDSRRRK